jgi:predicted metalloprotease
MRRRRFVARRLGALSLSVILAMLAITAGGEILAAPPTPVKLSADTTVPGKRPSDSLSQEVNDVAVLVNRFWADEFAKRGLEYRTLQGFGPYGAGRPVYCGNTLMEPGNAFYCGAGDFIAYDPVWLGEYYTRIGDAAVYVVIPHEWGHAVQQRLGTVFEFNIARELQADCYAGAFVAAAVRSGNVAVEEGDEGELLANLAEAADPTEEWWREDAHGSVAQRQTAFITGVQQGLTAC